MPKNSAPDSAKANSRWQLTRLRLATGAGNIVGAASRLAGKGSGASIRGQIITKLAPDAFGLLVANPRILAVSGTNGKTTTTHLLTAALRQAQIDPEQVATNADGANLHYGIASALSQNPNTPIAVLETDERVVSDMITKGRPEILVFLNFSRDQLDRHHEIKSLAKSWRTALENAGEDGPVVIGNASDPLVVWASSTATHTIWVNTATKWNEDSALCPNCGAMLRSIIVEGRRTWDCSSCELTAPKADYAVVGDSIRLPDGSVVTPELNVPGYFNLSNAACALAAAVSFGISVADALAGFAKVTSPAGRFALVHIGSAKARLILAKNPAGWAEALPLATSDPVVLAIDSVAADGKDVSWLWDVPFEVLAGHTVIASGPRAQDLAVRLTYAGVKHEIINDLKTAVEWRPKTNPDAADDVVNSPVSLPADAEVAEIQADSVEEPKAVIATYTPFQRLLKMAGLR